MSYLLTTQRRDEALKLLDRRGSILDLARELTALMQREGIPGVVIGGIAVLLHGYVRTTKDIDIFLDGKALVINEDIDRLLPKIYYHLKDAFSP